MDNRDEQRAVSSMQALNVGTYRGGRSRTRGRLTLVVRRGSIVSQLAVR